MQEVGDKIYASRGSWNFGAIDASDFESHVAKSVPGYEDGHKYIQLLSDYFLSDNSRLYDIGCSTGNLIQKISKYNSNKKNLDIIGIEPISSFEPLVEKNTSDLSLHHKFTFVNEPIQDADLIESDLIVSYYCIQFIHPRHRQKIFDKIYSSLNWGGGFFLFEKVRAPDARFQDMISTAYMEFKQLAGYGCDEILQKHLSLKGVLEPFTSGANYDFLKRSGFIDITTIYKNLCFEGILAIK